MQPLRLHGSKGPLLKTRDVPERRRMRGPHTGSGRSERSCATAPFGRERAPRSWPSVNSTVHRRDPTFMGVVSDAKPG
jgi:hypothetical protein